MLSVLLAACVDASGGNTMGGDMAHDWGTGSVGAARSAIGAANARLADALLSGDVRGLNLILAPDATLSGPGTVEWHGRPEVMDQLRARLGGVTYTSARFHTDGVQLAGGVAIETGRAGLAWTARGAAAPETLQLRYLTVWRRERDGSLRLLRSMRAADASTARR